MKKRLSPPDATADLSSSPAAADQLAGLAVEAMGAHGHGVALSGGKKVHIPFTLPGETIRARIAGTKGEAVSIDNTSPDRISPICRHFGICGGCALQHWREGPYAEWKVSLVKAALAREGLNAQIEPLRRYPVPSRRRATFTACKSRGEVRLGFNAARSHDLIDLAECPILLPQIASALPHLKAAMADALPNRDEAKVHITAAENGLDCSIEGQKLKALGVARLTQMLPAAGIIRASWNGDIIFLADAPFVVAGSVKVMLPQGAFLQAVEACERDMAAFVAEALAEGRWERGRSAIFSPGSARSLFPAQSRRRSPLSRIMPVAIAALAEAAKGASGIKPVKAIRRDLFRNPVGPMELNAFSAVVADPPREGAETQSRALAASKMGLVVMLSCNPATFARDAAILAAGGFALSRLAAFDQFKFSPHVEIAAAFMRGSSKKGRLAPALKR